MVKLSKILDEAPDNLNIVTALGRCMTRVNTHDHIMVSVSGGSDSDVMMDLIIRCGGKDKSTFVFFNTGLEYKATKEHIQYLNSKYDVQIVDVPPIKSIPRCVKEYGIPFWSKQVSDMMERLQNHGFQWEDEPLEILEERYPHCESALKWWCNRWGTPDKISHFDIDYVHYLKEFIIENPPAFRVSGKCCTYAKKKPSKKYLKEHECDMCCIGVRRAEGGSRTTRYSSCFSESTDDADQYRPLFYFTDQDKALYDDHYGITHSDCYRVWGMPRTGCAGCPFGQNFENELELAQKYEPAFYKAMVHIFGPSYDYRRKFLEFRKQRKEQEKLERHRSPE